MKTGGGRLNIGLCLKFEGKGLKVLGYSNKTLQGWEFSERAVLLIKEYLLRFPQVFSKIRDISDDLADTDIFGDNAPAMIVELKTWLKEKEIGKLVSVPIASNALPTV